jgi:hypothetical protein
MAPETRRKLERLFPTEQWPTAIAWLESECGSDLPLIDKQGADGIERVRCAALKLSGGSLDKLRTAVRVAQSDWRDVLVAAGFGHSVVAHLAWLKEDDDA